MTQIQVACPHCRLVVQAAPMPPGVPLRCPRCTQQFTIDGGSMPHPPASPAATQLPAVYYTPVVPNLESPAASTTTHRAGRRKSSNSTWIVVGLLLTVGGCLLALVLTGKLRLPAAIDITGSGGLPADFAFREVLTSKERISIEEAADKAGLKNLSTESSRINGKTTSTFHSGRDSISGVGGSGFESESNVVPHKTNRMFEFHYNYIVRGPISCYRDGKLLGIWDTDKRQLRPGRTGEAPESIKRP